MEKRNDKVPASAVVNRARVEDTIRKLERQITRLQPKIDELEEKKSRLSVHGFQDLGYFKGRLSAMQDVVDDLKGMLDTSEIRWRKSNG